jgi:hypothetical protein
MKIQFDHIAQAVPDVGQAVEWHRRLFPDLEVLHQDDSWAFVEAGGVRLAFVLSGRHPGHIGFRVGEEELEALARRFGQEIKPHRDGSRSFYLEAPGGGAIEFISYPSGNPYRHDDDEAAG